MSNSTRGEKIFTTDLADFGLREINILKNLLDSYLNNFNIIEGENLKVGFNMYSGYVFLFDDEDNTYMLNAGKLEKWVMCYECDREDFISNLNEDKEEYQVLCYECVEGDEN